MIEFMSGAILMACAACGLFFLKSWRTSGDRLFLLFALAFWAFALERWMLAVFVDSEFRFFVYLFRLTGFVLIASAIVDKNRQSSR